MASSQTQRAPLPPQRLPEKSKPGRPKAHPKLHGPQPARHIPWPEIFKHHISLVEGHLKMIEMVRKHTVEGSGNYHTISNLITRSKDMMYQAKNIAKTFVPPPDQLEQVPLGSSSDTMYPGYSPAHHEYGKAAEEFGKYASEAKRKGIEVESEGIDYKVGQSKGLAHMTLAQIRAANVAKNGASSGSDAGATAAPPKGSNSKPTKKEDAKANGAEAAGEPVFFMDSNPTPVNLSTTANSSAKRKATPEPVEANVSKRHEEKHGNSATEPEHPQETPEPVEVDFEDISGEVDARLKEKEERRKRKEQKRDEKKRKRESEGDSPVTAVNADAQSTTDVSQPKKKKTKKAEVREATAGSQKRKSAADDEETIEESSAVVAVEKPKKKKVKASHESTTREKGKKRGSAEEGEDEESSGKRKKRSKMEV